MELAQKGATASVPNRFKQLLITLSWTIEADFDLAAVYETKDGRTGIVYFNDLGDMNNFPFMQLSGDEGVGDSGGDNEEQMRITSLDEMKYVWIICWDYTKVTEGGPARFDGSDAKISVMDDKGDTHDVKLEAGSMGNTALVATIDNSSPMGAQLINASSATTLKGLSNLDQLLTFVRAA